jgi:hypothetical protein
MRKHLKILGALLLGGVLSTTAFAAPTSLQKCGSTQGKALAALLAGIVKESARICGKGEGEDILQLKLATMAKVAGSFDTKVSASTDKYNIDLNDDYNYVDAGEEDNCPFFIGDLPSLNVASATLSTAFGACTPSP